MNIEVVPLLTGAVNGSSTAQGSDNVNWSILTDDDLNSYECLMGELLDSVPIPQVYFMEISIVLMNLI